MKGVPLDPAIAGRVAAAVLQAAVDEDDAASPRSASLGRMLRCLTIVESINAWVGHLCFKAVRTPLMLLIWSAPEPRACGLRAGC